MKGVRYADWIQLAEDRVQSWDLVNVVMDKGD
jgi:hypothetical protein